MHPMDDSGLAYSRAEFASFGKAVGLNEEVISRMWTEAEPCAEDDANTSNYGNWSGVVTRPMTDVWIAQSYRSDFDTSLPLVRKSWSCGNLTEMGRSTGRHENGHPTAYGAGYIAAR